LTTNDPQILPGLDLPRFSAWLAGHHPELAGEIRGRVLTGGRSNLTYALQSGPHRLVLRRPPLGHVMQTAHDMKREFRIQQALQGSDVPVPGMHFFHDDSDGRAGVGSPFYVMDQVAGSALETRADNAAHGPGELHELSIEMAKCLAKLHEVDPAAVGLADFGRPEGYLERQVSRWSRQLEASSSRQLPELERLAQRLRTVPATGQVSLLHGDFKLNNALVSREAGTLRVAAVLDWEMSTIGDSLADLALFGLYWQMPYLDPIIGEVFESPVDHAAGYPKFSELVTAYSTVRGIPEPDLTWYLGFSAFKTAVITESIHYRFQSGATVGEGFERIGELTLPLARAGHLFLDDTTAAGGR